MRPIWFILVCVSFISALKLGDALLTHVGLQTGKFFEVNPFINTESFLTILFSPVPAFIYLISVFCAFIGAFAGAYKKDIEQNSSLWAKLDSSIGLDTISVHAISTYLLVACFLLSAVANNILGLIFGFTIIDIIYWSTRHVVGTLSTLTLLLIMAFILYKYLDRISKKLYNGLANYNVPRTSR